ncbi:hypothetical protein [Variovorax sp. Root473]|uniref:hypothetical protein n=1 Tax=Variovorax sp. Root473 TaxID=1736541 RepID=UPI0012F82F6B|nr:hypothetical protein [Variovorax sp. Root473]
MKQTKRTDFRAPLLVGWWLLWLVISQTAMNIAAPPSSIAVLHFVVLLAAFAAGFVFIKKAHRASAPIGRRAISTFPIHSTKVKWIVYGLSLLATILLLTSLQLSGAFTTGFMEYFARLRMDAQEAGGLTGIKILDTLTKVLAFPVSYGLILVILAVGVKPFRLALTICVLNFGLFSYLWQVNYPIIHLFWLAFFYMSSLYVDGAAINRRTMIGLALACALLVLSAMNRFGDGDDQLFGAVQRYVVGYHLIGFSFYDFQLANPNSILHVHTYGRSSLGFLEQFLEQAFRMIGVDYLAASSENAAYNDTAVSIGVSQAQDFNAFGTLAFTFYRDFHIVGIAIGGFVYGAAIAYGLRNLRRSWIAAGMFYLLATAWMMGMMVSPVEQTYFWFCLAFLMVMSLASRRWRIFPLPRRRWERP